MAHKTKPIIFLNHNMLPGTGVQPPAGKRGALRRRTPLEAPWAGSPSPQNTNPTLMQHKDMPPAATPQGGQGAGHKTHPPQKTPANSWGLLPRDQKRRKHAKTCRAGWAALDYALSQPSLKFYTASVSLYKWVLYACRHVCMYVKSRPKLLSSVDGL